MTPEASSEPGHDRDRAAEIFGEALDLPTGARAVFLDRACGATGALRDEIDSLLRAHDNAADFLAAPDPEGMAALLASAPIPTAEGRPIGPYRVVRELGRGGMGVVYLAGRVEGGFEQQVAVKLIKRGMDSDAIQQRFLAERQILARLEHPHIARLLDGGATEAGQPFFAMEYVEGEPIHRECDRRARTVEGRLRLFVDACSAVQYAHGRLVVHRDLKPSNMLVTADGTVKLLDFGVAKLLAGHDDVDHASLTRTGSSAMTPAYAAPEQMRGEAITTATDVYALGTVLYELLTGKRPFDDQHASAEEIVRATCDQIPTTPSQAVAASADAVAVAHSRQTRPSALRKRLEGDLDTIVLKALRKEPERRYASAQALAEDLKRHLDGSPVQARKDAVGYRASKFVARHRLAVTTAVIAVASLLAGLVGTAWQARVAAVERDRAQQEATKAETVKDFLVGLFEASDPAQALGEEITAKQLLERGVTRIEGELVSQPEIKAEMLAVVGGVYRSLGRYDRSRTLLEQSVTLAQETLGTDHPAVLRTRSSLAHSLQQAGELDAAASLYQSLLAVQRAHHGAHPDVAASLDGYAVVLNQRGDYEQARALYEEALAMRRALHGNDHPEVATSLHNLAALHWELADYDRSEALYRQALATRRRVLGDRHPDVAAVRGDLSVTLMEKGEYREAASLSRQALESQRALFGNDHPKVAGSLARLSALTGNMGDFEQAALLGRECLRLDRLLLGESHPSTAIAMVNLGRSLAELGRFDEADLLIDEAAEGLRATLPPDHSLQAAPLHMRVHTLLLRDRAAEALPLIASALALHRASVGPDHPRVLAALSLLAKARYDVGEVAEAEALWRQVLTAQRASMKVDHPRLAASLIGLGNALLAQGRYGAAETMAREALAIRQNHFEGEHWSLAEVESLLGACLTATGNPARAKAMLTRAANRLEADRGAWHPATRVARSRLNS